MLKAFQILNKIEQTNSINEKKELMSYDDELLKLILKAAYDPNIVFGVKKIPQIKKSLQNPLSKEKALRLLNEIIQKLSVEQLRGNQMRSYLNKKFNCFMDVETQKWFSRILQKDLKIGINKKLIQKVYPDLIPEYGYMGAVVYDAKKLDKLIATNRYIFSQEKMDGEYSNCVIKISKNNVEEVKFVSRSNKPQLMPKKIIDKIATIFKNHFDIEGYEGEIIFNGELVIKGYDRYTSNGLLTRIFKHQEYLNKENYKKAKKAFEIIEEIADCDPNELLNKIEYYIWDYIEKGKLPYVARWGWLSETLTDIEFFKLVENKIFVNEKIEDKENNLSYIQHQNLIHCDNEIELKRKLLEHFQEIVAQGGEGTIVKAGNGLWKNGKPVYQIKMKFEFECEMKVVGFKKGTKNTKFENSLGALICESEDGLVKADPSGLSEDLRDEIWNNQDKYIGKIVTVKCNALSKSKDKDYWALLHPRFVKFRDDKDIADDLKTIQEIEKSVKGLT